MKKVLVGLAILMAMGTSLSADSSYGISDVRGQAKSFARDNAKCHNFTEKEMDCSKLSNGKWRCDLAYTCDR